MYSIFNVKLEAKSTHLCSKLTLTVPVVAAGSGVVSYFLQEAKERLTAANKITEICLK
jgi:hypothetical protein